MMRQYFIVILLVGTLFPVYTAGMTISDEVQSMSIDMDFNATLFVEEIISTLEAEAQYDGGKLLGWEYRKNGAKGSDARTYVGYQTGMAGIGDFLLSAYLMGFDESKSLLDDILSYFMNHYNTAGGGINWHRESNAPSSQWVSMRYGTAGILRFLSHAYISYMDSSTELLGIMEDAYTWLLGMENDIGFPMDTSFFGYVTTDFEYGGTGIGEGMLDFYEATGDSKYLDDAKYIADWLIDFGIKRGDALRIQWAVNGDETPYENLFLTGIGAGQAGILDFMLRLYELSTDSTYLDAATQLGNELRDQDLGGHWFNGSVHYISGLHDHSNGLTGYYLGAAGTAIKLLELYDATGNTTYLESAARAEKFIEYNIDESNGRVNLGLGHNTSYYTGFSKGRSGIAQFYVDLYQRYGTQRYVDNINLIMSSVYDLFDDDAIIVDESDPEMGYSFNLEEGLAGIGMTLLDILEATSQDIDDGYEDEYQGAVANTVLGEFEIDTRDFRLVLLLAYMKKYIEYVIAFSIIGLTIGILILRKIIRFYKRRKLSKNPTET